MPHPPATTPPVQPLLEDAVVALRAPTQVWMAPDGSLGARAVHGVYHGDTRHLSSIDITCSDSSIETISFIRTGADRVTIGALLRGVDDASADPKVRLIRERRVQAGRLSEDLEVRTNITMPIDTELVVRLRPDFSSLADVKAGQAGGAEIDVLVDGGKATLTSTSSCCVITVDGGSITADGGDILLSWKVTAAPRSTWHASWSALLEGDDLVVHAVSAPGTWPSRRPELAPHDPALARWVEVALDDLDALRMRLTTAPDDEFFAAGAPWFFTLFGRDSLWTARLALPVDHRIAASTLRVLARLQGTTDDPKTAQEPGKIMHELRAGTLELPGEGVVLPPLYYGTVDATPLWVTLLHDAWQAGMPLDEVRALLPALRAALEWITRHGDSDGDGFLDYIDRSGRGLSNQGWKDSGDSIQWRDGTLAEGPIALCEVQGYAYEAAISGARVLDALGEPGGEDLRRWAAQLRARFAEAYWVQTPEGRYPAIALDAHKQPVDTLTSNIGHLLGTGILDPDDERMIADLLLGESMSSGFGVRTMSTDASGYWPLSYHGGSVWTHDSAIIAHGMARAGLHEHARAVVSQLVAAAEGFDFRVPELHSGDPRTTSAKPTPYPAACRPQAWSAAAAITAWNIRRG